MRPLPWWLRPAALLGLVACTGGEPTTGPTTDSPTDSPSDTGTIPTGPWTPQERIARLLRSDDATRLELRIHLPIGEVVPGDPWSRVVDLLAEVADKPDGITVDVREVDLPVLDWTLDDAQAQLDALARPVDDDLAVIEVLAVHGTWTDGDVLGLGWSWQRAMLLIDPLNAACNAAGGTGSHTRVCEATWAGVLRHEVGHLVGLVNNGAPMVTPHEDPEHPHHDPDPDCLMYWQWDRADVAGRLADQDLELCPASLADLAAVRDAPAAR